MRDKGRSIKKVTEVYEKYILDKDELDYDFDDDALGVTMCKITDIHYTEDDDDKNYQICMRTPWGFKITKSEYFKDVIGNESSFIYQVSKLLDEPLSSVNNIKNEEIPVIINNVYSKESYIPYKKVYCNYEINIDLVRESDLLYIKLMLDEPLNNEES